ncbi:hypothetical protein EV646_104117 [Kribbella antiqua]|uniref:Adhesin n=1 Tax=Kribbella antiqua TaxID=2512217 RepID=A0A4V2S4I1_9ACTN|nr:hypothetical protein [Kribbella antiqua]TCO48300.1 hypothetical protein EV646_104117 [Kribbella antiqua]
MSNQSDYDRRVKDILDRVANGHLSTEEGATLIAAIQPAAAPADSAGPAEAAEKQAPVADVPSPSVWAEVVDAVPGPSGAVSEPPAADGDAVPSTNGLQDSVVDDAPAGAAPGGPATGGPGTGGPATGGPATGGPATAAPTDATLSGDEPEEPVEPGEPVEPVEAEEEVEEEHSHVPIPAGVQRVTVRAIGRRVRLIGEPAINGVAVDGPHVIKRDGETLAISSEGDMGVSIDGFSMLRNPTNLKSHVNGLAKELSIRVNPTLQVEVEVTGGSVAAERLPGLTRVRVTAGTAKVSDVDGPIDLLVQAGTATLDAQITKGRSRVRVESGAANVTLRRGSDVRVHTESQLGRVSWTGAVTGQSKDVEIGRGRASLDVEVLVGTAQITSD